MYYNANDVIIIPANNLSKIDKIYEFGCDIYENICNFMCSAGLWRAGFAEMSTIEIS